MKPLKFMLYQGFLLICLLFIMGLPAIANENNNNKKKENMVTFETVVVTGTKTEIPLDQSTKSINVIMGEELLEKQQFFLPELIDNQPGVYLKRNGGIGQFSTISIRGAGTQHTMFQYNGMPLRDIADTQSTLQFFIEDMFASSSVDRVEILKGTNSTLHGSQAMGGVINIIPVQNKDGFSGQWRNEFGPNNTYITQGNISYGNNKGYIDFSPSYIKTDGETNGGPHGYYYDSKGFTLGAGYDFTDATSLQFTALASDSDLALGTTASLDASHKLKTTIADKDKHRESKLSQFGLVWNHTLTNIWDYTVKGTYGETERHYFWTATPGDQSNYDGVLSFIEMQHNFALTEHLNISLGMDYEKQVFDGQEPLNKWMADFTPVIFHYTWNSWDTFGLVQGNFMDDALLINVGGRYNDHEKFGSKAVWETSAAYTIKSSNTKFHSHIGTGYRTPSLYEIYGGYLSGGVLITIGNKNLQPEESLGWEIGVEQNLLARKMTMGVTYFQTKFNDLIIYDRFNKQYANASTAQNKGFEVYIKTKPLKNLSMDFAYTHMDSKYKATKTSTRWTQKEYLPENIIDMIITWYPIKKLTLSCDVSFQGEKIVPLYDPTWTKVRYKEDKVTTVDLAVTYNLSKHLDLWIRAENLLDKDYTESGYQMPGRSLFGGFRVFF